jgi:hypothetical protein
MLPGSNSRQPQPATADGPMTAEQAALLKRLAQAAYKLDAFKPHLTRTEADNRPGLTLATRRSYRLGVRPLPATPNTGLRGLQGAGANMAGDCAAGSLEALSSYITSARIGTTPRLCRGRLEVKTSL